MSLQAARSPTPGLARVPLPAPGEHASGYFRRLAEANGLLLSDFRVMFGIRRISPRSSLEAWTCLAQGLGVPVDMFSPMMWRPVSARSRRWVSFLEHEIHDSFLYLKTIQICRPCLVTTGIVRNAWSLRLLTACHDHKIQLSDACPGCGRAISLVRSYEAWTCSQCGTDFRSGPTTPATYDEIAIAQWLEARLSGQPSDIPTVSNRISATSNLALDPDTSTLHEMLTSLLYLGKLRETADRDRPAQYVRLRHSPLFLQVTTTSDEARRINRAAFGILGEWPSAYHSILEGLVDKFPAPESVLPLLQHFASEAGVFAVRRLQDRLGQALPFITSERLQFLEARIGYRPRGRIPRRTQQETDDKPQAPTATMLSEEAVRGELFGDKHAPLTPLIEAGALTPLKIGQGRLAFAVDEVRTITALIRALPAPPPGRTDLKPALRRLRSLYRYAGASAEFFRLVFEHTIDAYAAGPTLRDLLIPEDDCIEIQVLAKLRHDIVHNKYADLPRLNKMTEQLWGPFATYRTIEANQLVAAGKLRFKRVAYNRRGDPRLFHVGDIVRDIQSWTEPTYFDVDELELRLPGPSAATSNPIAP